VSVERIADNAIAAERTNVYVKHESPEPVSWSLQEQLGAELPLAWVYRSERYAIGDHSHVFR